MTNTKKETLMHELEKYIIERKMKLHNELFSLDAQVSDYNEKEMVIHTALTELDGIYERFFQNE